MKFAKKFDKVAIPHRSVNFIEFLFFLSVLYCYHPQPVNLYILCNVLSPRFLPFQIDMAVDDVHGQCNDTSPKW